MLLLVDQLFVMINNKQPTDLVKQEEYLESAESCWKVESEWIVESVERPVWWAVVGGVDVFLLFFVYTRKLS